MSTNPESTLVSIPSMVEVELSRNLSRHPSLRKGVRGKITNWNGFAHWSVTVYFPDAEEQEVSWEQVRIVDSRILESELFLGLLNKDGTCKSLDRNERVLGRIIDGLQFLRLSWKKQEEVLPDLAECPEAFSSLLSKSEVERVTLRNLIGSITSERLLSLEPLIQRPPERDEERKYFAALESAGANFSTLFANTIRIRRTPIGGAYSGEIGTLNR